jgi:hypothetical protein
MRRGATRDAVLLGPALLFVALHLPALDYGLVWTDEPEIVHGSILRPPGRILHAFAEPLHATGDFAAGPFIQPYYRPLQVASASLLAAHFGREARVFRSASLLLGAITATLFTALALVLLGSRPAALAAGCLFAAHPVGIEIYVWVGGLAAAFVGAFVVTSLLCGALALRAAPARHRLVFGGLSLAALVLGLLSKENAATVPGLQLALLLGWAAQDPRFRERAAAGALLVAAQAAIVAGYLFALRPAVLGGALTGADPIGGRLAVQWLTSLASWPQQLGWLFLPLHSTTSDVVRVVTSPLDPAAALGALLLTGSGLLFVLWLRAGHGIAAFALAWIWIAFLPTSGLAPLLHARAERNLFLSAFGAALLLPCAAARLRQLRAPPALPAALAVVAVVGLSERTWRRQPDWRSTAALFATDVAAEPRYREGRLNLMAALVKAGDLPAAKRHVDVLVDQRAPQGWTSYALDSSLLEAACLVNQAVGRDPDTLRLVETAPPAGGVGQMPGFYACYAGALEREGRCDQAGPLYERLAGLAPGAEGVRFASSAARCRAASGAR